MTADIEVSPSAVKVLRHARAAYTVPDTYDEVLKQVAHRIEHTGEIGKADVGALVFWKRLKADTPWVAEFLKVPDADVRATTRAAVTAVRDQRLTIPEAARQGRRALTPLPGFESGDAVASALLLAAAPTRMAVYDRRAHQGVLTLLGVELGTKSRRYERYMSIVTDLMDAVNAADGLADARALSPRDVDLALYTLGDGTDA